MPNHAENSQTFTREAIHARMARYAAANILLLGGATALTFLFSLLNRYFFLAELASSLRVQLLVLMLVCGIGLAVLRRWRRGVLLVAISVSFLISLLLVHRPASQPPPGEERLTVMAMNVLADNWQYDEVVAHIREVDPDVVLIVEYSHSWHEHLSQLSNEYPYELLQPRWHGYGMAIFSKRPLEQAETWQLTREKVPVPALIAEISVGAKRLRLAGLHTMSPMKNIRFELRNRQMAEITERLTDSDVPTMLIGDFNCTPWASVFQDMLTATGFRDSRLGQGYLASWNMTFPWPLHIPIDHALVSNEIHVHQRTTGRPCGSDHLPTIIEISLTP